MENAVTEYKQPDMNIYVDNRLKNSLFAPDKAKHYQNLAIDLAKTDLVPDHFKNKPMDLFLAMAYGYSIGLTVEQSIQDIAVINKRPCVYGDALLGIVKSQPDFADILEEPTINNGQVVGFVCTVKRRGQTDTVRAFDFNMARKAGLLNRPMWQKWPERMLQMRARGFAVRDAFADALKGIKSYEEVIDYIDDESESVKQKRTDEIKEHLTNKAQDKANDKDDKEIISKNENNKDTSQTSENEVHERMDKTGKSKAKNHIAPESSIEKLIGLEDLSRIDTLMKMLNFDKNRIKKALEFYQCEHLSDLNQRQGEDLLLKLQGMVNKDD